MAPISSVLLLRYRVFYLIFYGFSPGYCGKVSFDNVPGSTCTDILTAMARGEAGEGDSKDYNNMRVGTLRKMLDEKGLDVDGSRESMIALLKEQSA